MKLMHLSRGKSLPAPRTRRPLITRPAAFGFMLAAAALGLAGCANRPPLDPMIEAVETGERPVAMRGEATFFGNVVKATVTVSKGLGKGSPESRAARKKRAGFFADDDLPSIDSTGTEEDQRKQYEDFIKVARLHVRGAPMPPVTLRLFLESTDATEREIEIREVNSDLGNFAVRPATLKTATDHKVEPDPMISQLGVTSDEIPVKVTLRSGGKTETQTVLVKSIFTGKVVK